LAVCGIGWFVWFGSYSIGDSSFFWSAIVTYVLLLGIFWAATAGKFDVKLAYLATRVYDLILIPALLLSTGGPSSPFYLLYFLTISVAAYLLTLWFATIVSFIVVLSLVSLVVIDTHFEALFDITMRSGFVLVYNLAISYASDYLRNSERRLLSLFDTLTKRTSELEKSQAQVEMIYENSRTLASIFDTESIVNEIIRILDLTMQFRRFAIVFRDKEGKFYYHARSDRGQTNRHPSALTIEESDLIYKVCDLKEAIRIGDITDRDDYRALDAETRSVIIVPLASHGRSTGVLVAESTLTDFYIDRDIQMLSIVARSASMALENAELHKKTAELTIIDELTGAYNYRYFIRKLDEENRRARRYGHQLSIIMVDIDWFKKLNDRYGHEIGNRVLQHLSGLIKQCIRDVDIFCRYGGEEFVVILPQTGRSEAFRLAERIRRTVETTPVFIAQNEPVRTTVSVGLSSYPDNGASQEQLVSIADKALYQAKGDGRNGVCVM
jgi:diguanylate cyclase (GGDEF)-like protein